MKVLLTNDDGPDSPLLAFTIETVAALPGIALLKIAIPDSEQSWKSHAMSGHGSINPRVTEIAGAQVTLVDGTPADCVDWAMHNLFAGGEWPDLVISGVNCGKNTGLGFILSSATIGACLHANVAEPPRAGLAFSQDFHDLAYGAALKAGEVSGRELAGLRVRIKSDIERVWAYLRNKEQFLRQPLTWNVNFPETTGPGAPITETSIGDSRLKQCFQERGGRFQHSLAHYIEDPSPGSDGTVLARGQISISRLDIRRLCAATAPAEHQP
ncbi:MAG: 5'/3'-nucleotidase SurE [Deltaproteobacteria bacterium]|jgi:5'/3'-nucleotidase SurE|nr:5'/3'-nucleotidase SurE [Deltaproteobacteria bacterium]